MKIATNIKILVFLLSFIFIAFGCTRKSFDVLSKKKMEAILYDLYIMDAMNKNSSITANQPENRIEYVNGIMKKHNTTQSIFNKSLAWYSDNMADLTTINEKVTQRLSVLDSVYINQNKSFIKYKFGQYDENMPKIYNLDDINNIFSFKLDSFKIHKITDVKSIDWKFKLVGIRNSSQVNANFILTFTDSTINRKISNLTDGDYNLTYNFPKDSLNDSFWNLIDISGYIYLNDTTKQNKNIYLKDSKLEFDTIFSN